MSDPAESPESLQDELERIARAEQGGRCTACGRYLSANSTYTNRCADCWTKEDDFL